MSDANLVENFIKCSIHSKIEVPLMIKIKTHSLEKIKCIILFKT